MPESFEKLSKDYFDLLAKTFPVMCASDEFHFMPRAVAASLYYDQMETLDAEIIERFISEIKEYRRKFNLLAVGENELETLIDIELIDSSIESLLIELDENRAWRRNPLLYLKIAFIGLDHALTKPAENREEIIERTTARLKAISLLLRNGRDNLRSTPLTYHQAAIAMLNDCSRYLSDAAKNLSSESLGPLMRELENARAALKHFGAALSSINPVPDRDLEIQGIQPVLQRRFRSPRNPDEVFQMAVEEWSENLEALAKIQKEIAPDRSWIELIQDYFPADASGMDAYRLYEREIERQKGFFESTGFKKFIPRGRPIVSQTPAYLQSVRGSASYSAAFSKDPREKDFFFIGAKEQDPGNSQSGDPADRRFHREHKFLTAHESIPGHYLLDYTRRFLDNPVRSQIESPLFYEGWSYYAESLLVEYGYADHPMDRLIDHKRRLWRAARCQIDVGLNTGGLLPSEALQLLTSAGFSLEESKRQLDLFRLNPGYQLCYSLGRFEIMQLRKAHSAGRGLDDFHDFLLRGGQLPFHLIEKRFNHREQQTVEHQGGCNE